MQSDKKIEILMRVNRLLSTYKTGGLGGEIMPEDANPGLPKDSAENYAYFTLPMSLNYQRNSYTLWKCAHQSYLDADTRDIFCPLAVAQMDVDTLKEKLLKYLVALQPNKQPVIWKIICTSFAEFFQGDIRNLFSECDYSVMKVKRFFADNKKAFPYLGGEKILNYWLFVMQSYTDLLFCDRSLITVAPDTHVIQASVRLSLITEEQSVRSDVRQIVAAQWSELLEGTSLQPIDVHTPLWLWSRGKFLVDI
jgi:hypothetical protein